MTHLHRAALFVYLAACGEGPLVAGDVTIDGKPIWSWTWTPQGSSTPTLWEDGGFQNPSSSPAVGCLGATQVVVLGPVDDTYLGFSVPSGDHHGDAVWTPASSVAQRIAWPDANGEVVALPWVRARAAGKVDGAIVFEVEGFPGETEPCLDCEALLAGVLTATSASRVVDEVYADFVNVPSGHPGAPSPSYLAEPPGTTLCERKAGEATGGDTDELLDP